MASWAVDFDLGEHREADVVARRTELLDFGFVARLLMAELIAGKAEHGEAAGFELSVELFEAGVLGREPAIAGDVDDEQHLAAIVGQRLSWPSIVVTSMS